jgi:hypothetical protein
MIHLYGDNIGHGVFVEDRPDPGPVEEYLEWAMSIPGTNIDIKWDVPALNVSSGDDDETG